MSTFKLSPGCTCCGSSGPGACAYPPCYYCPDGSPPYIQVQDVNGLWVMQAIQISPLVWRCPDSPRTMLPVGHVDRLNDSISYSQCDGLPGDLNYTYEAVCNPGGISVKRIWLLSTVFIQSIPPDYVCCAADNPPVFRLVYQNIYAPAGANCGQFVSTTSSSSFAPADCLDFSENLTLAENRLITTDPFDPHVTVSVHARGDIVCCQPCPVPKANLTLTRKQTGVADQTFVLTYGAKWIFNDVNSIYKFTFSCLNFNGENFYLAFEEDIEVGDAVQTFYTCSPLHVEFVNPFHSTIKYYVDE